MNPITALLKRRIGNRSLLSFAKKIGINHQTIRFWLDGDRQITHEGMKLLGQAFVGDREMHKAMRAYWDDLFEQAINPDSTPASRFAGKNN